jgi:hypothetical protein
VIAVFCLFLAFALPSWGQTASPPYFNSDTNLPTNIFGVGVSGNTGGNPYVAGGGDYWRLASATSNTYSVTFLDVLPVKGSSGIVTTNVSTGVAQHAFDLKVKGLVIPIYPLASFGVAVANGNPSWNVTGGVAAYIPLKNSSWMLMPNVRYAKQGNAGYTILPGIELSFGQ